MRQLSYLADESTRRFRLKTGWARRDSQTRKRLVTTLSCITCSLENNAFSVLHYLIKVTLRFLTLPYVTSRRDSFCLGIFAHALLGCRLAASRLREAVRWQLCHFWTLSNSSSFEFATSCYQIKVLCMRSDWIVFVQQLVFREDKALSSLVVVNKHKFVHDRSTYETWLRKLKYSISGQQVKRWGISSKFFAWFRGRNLVGLCYHGNGWVSTSSFSIFIPYHLLFRGKRMWKEFFQTKF